jgi:omega-6 fatty acid desaturase (delta-12 desaturase)
LISAQRSTRNAASGPPPRVLVRHLDFGGRRPRPPIARGPAVATRFATEMPLWWEHMRDPMTDNALPTPPPPALPETQRLPGVLARYRDPKLAWSLTEIAVTLAPLVALWAAMWALMHVSYWLTLALALPAAGFLVRLFLIQHDCGHGSFFRHRALNDWVGRVFGVVTLTPYDYWKRTHATHHATAGNLDRLYRHPLVMFGLGPTYLFLLQHRAPLGLMGEGWKPWLSTMSTNFAAAIVIVLLMWLIGPAPFLLIHGPIFVLSATIGVWLFYVQHQFENTRWAHEAQWSLPEAALHGSSYYDLPPVLRWFSANIGVHHVHHLSSRIPFYRLREVLRDYPELGAISRVTLWQSLRCVNYTLWDEDAQRLISFGALRRKSRVSGAAA